MYLSIDCYTMYLSIDCYTIYLSIDCCTIYVFIYGCPPYDSIAPCTPTSPQVYARPIDCVIPFPPTVPVHSSSVSTESLQ